jgi:hypothetical protein
MIWLEREKKKKIALLVYNPEKSFFLKSLGFQEMVGNKFDVQFHKSSRFYNDTNFFFISPLTYCTYETNRSFQRADQDLLPLHRKGQS